MKYKSLADEVDGHPGNTITKQIRVPNMAETYDVNPLVCGARYQSKPSFWPTKSANDAISDGFGRSDSPCNIIVARQRGLLKKRIVLK